MKTITVKMPEAVAARLERRARRLGRAKSALVREAVERILEDDESEETPTAYERLTRGLGCVATGVGDLSTNPEHLEGFGNLMQVILLDTGPLVASLDASDAWHLRTLGALETIREPLLTCEAVLAETCFLLRHHKSALRAIDRWLEEGDLRLEFSLAEHHQRVFSIMQKYADLPASLADACLVVMSELHADARVFTLDHHFEVYRRHGRRIIPRVEI